ncbi:Ku protein [Conexibacter sp. SYSU D00693]|uniref:non-homologous end joining protein Ku n=1 Tax=Conexibacter sp. SYSU D00693 TaxID=2812560 RepID=UPI00196B9DEA|nr:Ku protein [Conexibacter sp. SYSU D00693]
MARALWTGSLSFGLVNVPVQLFSAVRDLDVHFRQLHEKDGAPIDTRRFCAKEDVEISYDELGRGFELDDGTQVVLTDAELETADPRKTRTIDIEAFVDLDEVDPVLYDHPYFLLPSGEGEGAKRAYELLIRVMESTDRAALGRFVMRTKEYLVAVRVRDGLLSLTTMRFHDEVRPVDEIPTGGRKPSKAQLDQAVALIESLSADWDPTEYTDRHRERLLAVIRDKKKGKKVKVPEKEDQPEPVADLMAALRKSLAQVRGEDVADDDEEDGGEDLGSLTKDELLEKAADADVSGRSSMTKKQLVQALSD